MSAAAVNSTRARTGTHAPTHAGNRRCSHERGESAHHGGGPNCIACFSRRQPVPSSQLSVPVLRITIHLSCVNACAPAIGGAEGQVLSLGISVLLVSYNQLPFRIRTSPPWAHIGQVL